MRIELLRGDVLTCWIELPAADLDAAPDVTALVEREVATLLGMRYRRGAAS